MKISRVSAATLTFAALSLLAACGGGGGGGGGVNPPGGGGGGGGPTPTPVGSTQPTPTPTPTSTSTPSGTTITAEEGWGPNGAIWYTSGVTASWTNTAGDAKTGFSGVDGMTCQSITEQTYPAGDYAQHSFVGIYYNGAEQALPQAIGMKQPVEPTKSGHTNDFAEVESNTCEYQMHTHDYSGLVHVADPSMPQSTTTSPSYATLQTLVDEWGATLSATGLTAGSNTLSGATTIYVGQPSTQVGGNDLVTSYAPTTASVKLGHHTAVWIVIGTPPASLPNVKFVVEN